MDKNNKQCQHEHHGGGFTNGFLFGFIVGGIVVFLLGTQKGKQIMQTLAESGFEGISDMLDEDEDEDEEYEEYVDDTPGPEEVSTSEGELTPAPVIHEKRVVVVHHHPRPSKRLFRGIRK